MHSPSTSSQVVQHRSKTCRELNGVPFCVNVSWKIYYFLVFGGRDPEGSTTRPIRQKAPTTLSSSECLSQVEIENILRQPLRLFVLRCVFVTIILRSDRTVFMKKSRVMKRTEMGFVAVASTASPVANLVLVPFPVCLFPLSDFLFSSLHRFSFSSEKGRIKLLKISIKVEPSGFFSPPEINFIELFGWLFVFVLIHFQFLLSNSFLSLSLSVGTFFDCNIAL